MSHSMIEAMREAGELARKASTIDGFRTLEVVLTEDGFIVRGEDGPGSDQRRTYSTAIGWPEFFNRPALLANSVRLVAARFGVVGLA